MLRYQDIVNRMCSAFMCIMSSVKTSELSCSEREAYRKRDFAASELGFREVRVARTTTVARGKIIPRPRMYTGIRSRDAGPIRSSYIGRYEAASRLECSGIAIPGLRFLALC